MKEDARYDRPIKVGEGIYWVGFRDDNAELSCNPYLVVQGNAAVLIDAGSRTDFAVVMMRVLQAGIDPGQIDALIYQHYDPDLCGSMSNFIDMCESPHLRIISGKSDNIFIAFYIHRKKRHLLESIEDHDYSYSLNGRILRFTATPYSHNPGSFVTYDESTRTLFSSDLFGGYGPSKDLFTEFDEACFTCTSFEDCVRQKPFCPVKAILDFHKKVMPCCKALQYAIGKIKKMDIQCIAPQHGGVLKRKRDIGLVIERMEGLEGVGIDGILRGP